MDKLKLLKSMDKIMSKYKKMFKNLKNKESN